MAIHLKEKKILTLENIKLFEATLPVQNFIRVHKSYLVTLDKTSFIEHNRIVIKDQRLPIGATYKDTFWAKIGN